MCPAAPPDDIGVYPSDKGDEISSESPLAGIGFCSSDEEVVMTLERIVRGCSLPANVITEVNPYNVVPWDLPDGIWYFFSMEDPKATETGYWKATGEHHRIFVNSSTTGSRLTLEFYLRQAPHDAMLINQKQLHEIDKAKDSHSLSRVFLNYSQGSNTKQQQRNKAKAIPNELNIEKDDESVPWKDPRYTNSIQDLRELCDISKGDFLELLDLDNSESSSSSSINSRRLSFSSDEYFDPEDILRALDSGNDQYHEQKFTDGKKLSVSAPTRLVQVVLRPESLGNDRCVTRVEESHFQDSSLSLIAANESVEGGEVVPCKKKVTDLSLQASISKEAEPQILEGKVLQKSTVQAIVWEVWRERNRRVFDEVARSEEQIWWSSCGIGIKNVQR